MEFEVHIFGQSAYVVVALDDFAGDVEALDAVGIDSALRQPLGIRYFLRFGVEDFHKVAAYDLTLLFRLFHSGQVGKEFVAGIHANDIESESFVVVHDIAELVFAEHAVVHEDTGQLVSYGAVEQYCHNR